MKFKLRHTIYLAVMAILAGSCETDPDFQYFVDEPMRDYFARFEQEAAQRGYTFDLEAMQVSGDIRFITTSNVIGQCLHSEEEPNTVIVDKTYWESANDMEREFLVFHELGHCALNRDHLDTADGRGDCISIMTSGTGACRVNYNVSNRAALLDELFTP